MGICPFEEKLNTFNKNAFLGFQEGFFNVWLKVGSRELRVGRLAEFAFDKKINSRKPKESHNSGLRPLGWLKVSYYQLPTIDYRLAPYTSLQKESS